ncbi:hypothetical protein FHX45_000709 [Amycolatopsis granulosa]|nr:hypothetical protein [Amycolatopsis granulosa]
MRKTPGRLNRNVCTNVLDTRVIIGPPTADAARPTARDIA